MPIELEGARHFGAEDYGATYVAGQRARYERGLYAARCRWTRAYLDRAHVDRRLWLDAGTGIGVFASELARRGAFTVGVDFAPATLGAARELAAGAQLCRADLGRLPFGGERFDGALALDVLEHLLEPAALLGELARVLRDGATLILSTDNSQSPSRWRGLRRVLHWTRRGAAKRALERVRREFPAPSNHVRLYAPSEVFALLASAGFRVKRWDTFPRQSSAVISRLLATPLASALCRGIRGGELIVEAERRR